MRFGAFLGLNPRTSMSEAALMWAGLAEGLSGSRDLAPTEALATGLPIFSILAVLLVLVFAISRTSSRLKAMGLATLRPRMRLRRSSRADFLAAADFVSAGVGLAGASDFLATTAFLAAGLAGLEADFLADFLFLAMAEKEVKSKKGPERNADKRPRAHYFQGRAPSASSAGN